VETTSGSDCSHWRVLSPDEFFQRITELARLSNERNQIKAEVLQLTATVQQLYTEIAEATSQSAVEEWAREEGHMALPGDYLVVPVSPSLVTPTPAVVSTPSTSPVANWEVWWALFSEIGCL